MLPARVFGCSSLLVVLIICAQSVWIRANGSVLSDEVEAGHERIRQIVQQYEVVHVDTKSHEELVSRRRRSARQDKHAGHVFMHPESASFSVEAFGLQMKLKLHLNSDLVALNYELQDENEDGTLVREPFVDHCHYVGTVSQLEGDDRQGDSFAAISTCNGLSGMFSLGSGENVFCIEPLVARAEANGSHLHAVYRTKDATKQQMEGVYSESMDTGFLLQRAEELSRRVRRSASTTTTNSPKSTSGSAGTSTHSASTTTSALSTAGADSPTSSASATASTSTHSASIATSAPPTTGTVSPTSASATASTSTDSANVTASAPSTKGTVSPASANATASTSTHSANITTSAPSTTEPDSLTTTNGTASNSTDSANTTTSSPSTTGNATSSSYETDMAVRPELFVELALVLDYPMYQLFSKSTAGAQDYALRLVNLGNLLLRPIKITISLVGIRVFTSPQAASEYLGTPDVYTKLPSRDVNRRFNRWRNDVLVQDLPHDVAFMITNSPLEGAPFGVGSAYFKSICSQNFSSVVVVNRHGLHLPAGTVGVFVNTLGQSLGLPLNPPPAQRLIYFQNGILYNTDVKDSRVCTCSADVSSGGCIMDQGLAIGVIKHPQWTKCSEEACQSVYDNGSLSCLENKPEELFPLSRCGNGYVDEGEECDCGPASECKDRCCSPSTCRFAPGAVCSGGPCCHECQHRSTAHVCRPAVQGGCDVEERCTGDDAKCPADIFVQSGKKCGTNGNDGNCDGGLCRTHNNQCTRLWSPVNKILGRPTRHTELCTPFYGESHCGRLYCKRIYGFMPGRLDTNDQGRRECSGFMNSNGTGPEMVDNFTRCGTGRVCMNAICTSIASLNIPSCPMANGKECGGHGVCTSLNTCDCQEGRTGPTCTTAASRTLGTGAARAGLTPLVVVASVVAAMACIYQAWSYRKRRSVPINKAQGMYAVMRKKPKGPAPDAVQVPIDDTEIYTSA